MAFNQTPLTIIEKSLVSLQASRTHFCSDLFDIRGSCSNVAFGTRKCHKLSRRSNPKTSKPTTLTSSVTGR